MLIDIMIVIVITIVSISISISMAMKSTKNSNSNSKAQSTEKEPQTQKLKLKLKLKLKRNSNSNSKRSKLKRQLLFDSNWKMQIRRHLPIRSSIASWFTGVVISTARVGHLRGENGIAAQRQREHVQTWFTHEHVRELSVPTCFGYAGHVWKYNILNWTDNTLKYARTHVPPEESKFGTTIPYCLSDSVLLVVLKRRHAWRSPSYTYMT